ncbi:MAG: MBL fold metallo-hydrolase [Christensenella sp.]|nr:MBL fold metallo-hydrolase [Christensenella sp.]
MNAQITYLDNSGFLIKTPNHTLIFDDWLMEGVAGKKGLPAGAVDPREISGENVWVFASHAHGDHYNPKVLRWKNQIESIHYVFSDDIKPVSGALMAAPNKEYIAEDIKIKTYRSTDEGVAFLLETDGLVVYHAGDLNWWHWEGEDPAWNAQMAKDYQAEIKKLQNESIDIAFVPVDPRLLDSCTLGIKLFMETVGNVQMVIPMHYRSQAAFAEKELSKLPLEWREKIVPPMERGQTVSYKKLG